MAATGACYEDGVAVIWTDAYVWDKDNHIRLGTVYYQNRCESNGRYSGGKEYSLEAILYLHAGLMSKR